VNILVILLYPQRRRCDNGVSNTNFFAFEVTIIIHLRENPNNKEEELDGNNEKATFGFSLMGCLIGKKIAPNVLSVLHNCT